MNQISSSSSSSSSPGIVISCNRIKTIRSFGHVFSDRMNTRPEHPPPLSIKIRNKNNSTIPTINAHTIAISKHHPEQSVPISTQTHVYTRIYLHTPTLRRTEKCHRSRVDENVLTLFHLSIFATLHFHIPAVPQYAVEILHRVRISINSECHGFRLTCVRHSNLKNDPLISNQI